MGRCLHRPEFKSFFPGVDVGIDPYLKKVVAARTQHHSAQEATNTINNGNDMEHREQIIALGFFDGVHLGHQALVAQCLRLAEARGAEPAAITFQRHPQALFTPDPPALINTTEDREALLKAYGIRKVYALPVTKEVMSTNWQAFLEQRMALGAAGFVCGADFRFGARGEGSAETLAAFCRERGLPWVVVPDQLRDGARISSTRIRQLLEAGNAEKAAEYLGHPHRFTGTVVPGKQLGRTIGIPTANLRLPGELLVPKFGVYACRAYAAGKWYPAVTNVGTRPTVNGQDVTVEPWLLDFSGDLYGQELTLEFCQFLRPEEKFPSLDALKQAILRDAEATRKLV